MADQATEQMSVSASPERCFAVVADIERYPEWAADIKEVVVEERDDQGRPVLVTFRAAAFGRSTSYTLRYDFSEAPHILSWKLTKGDITSKLDGSYVFDPDEGSGTHVTLPPGGRTARADSGLHQECGPRAASCRRPCGS